MNERQQRREHDNKMFRYVFEIDYIQRDIGRKEGRQKERKKKRKRERKKENEE